jgi:hypothetical protein
MEAVTMTTTVPQTEYSRELKKWALRRYSLIVTFRFWKSQNFVGSW